MGLIMVGGGLLDMVMGRWCCWSHGRGGLAVENVTMWSGYCCGVGRWLGIVKVILWLWLLLLGNGTTCGTFAPAKCRMVQFQPRMDRIGTWLPIAGMDTRN